MYPQRFKKGFYEALDDVHTHYVQTSHLYRPGEKATIMYVHVRDRMNQNFAGVPGVKIEDKSGRAYKVKMDGAPYGIDAKAEFKCKKVGAKLLTSSIRTKAVVNFEKGLPEIRPHVQHSLGDWREPEITGGVEPAHGNASYVIDALWSRFERLCIKRYTGPRSARLAVDIPLDGVGAPVIEIPLADITEVPPRKRVRPRKKKEAEAKPPEKTKKHIKLKVIDGGVEEKRRKARNYGEDS